MATKAARPRRRRAQQRSETADFLRFLLKLAIAVFIVRSFIVAPFSIPSESMQPRLLIGDYLIAEKWPYGFSRYSLPFDLPLIPGRIFAAQPKRGDVVIFRAPPRNDRDYVKRVIGLPGDRIQMRGGRVILNGAAVPHERIADLVVAESADSPCFSAAFREAGDGAGSGPVCRYPRYRETLAGDRGYDVLDLGDTPADDTPVFTVPAGRLFLMGDNRDRSADSRFPAEEGAGIGIVPQANLVGKPLVIVFSTDGSPVARKPWTWLSGARWSRVGEGF